MPKNIQLPDGRTLVVPDGATPDQLSALRQQLSVKFGSGGEAAQRADETAIYNSNPIRVPGGNVPLDQGLKEASALASLAGLLQGFSESQGGVGTRGGVAAAPITDLLPGPVAKLVSSIQNELGNWRISWKVPGGLKSAVNAISPWKVTRVAPGEAEAATPGVSVPPERTTGQFDAAIKQAGAVPGGIQKGDPSLNIPNYAMFHDRRLAAR